MFVGHLPVFRLYPWFLTVSVSCLALLPLSTPQFNPCYGQNFPVQRRPSHRNAWQREDLFLRKVLNDLLKTIQVTDEIIKRLEEDFENTDHISNLRGREKIDTLIWEPLQGLPFQTQLLNIYASLRRVDIFARHLRELLTSTEAHNSQKRVIYSMLTQIGQGNGSGGGIYQILCDIYSKIQIVEPVVETVGLIPSSLQGEKHLAQIQDDFYHVLMNTQRVLNGLTGHLNATLQAQSYF